MNRNLLLIVLILFLIPVVKAQSVIGEFYPSNEIKIEEQDYIDKYFYWQFTEINNTHWFANFSIDKDLLNNITYCRDLTNPIEKLQCWQNVKNTFFPEYNLTSLIEHLTSFLNQTYPLRNLTKNIDFSNFQINLTEGRASFYIIFPEGFKEGERAKFGFKSTIIATTVTDPFYSYLRVICSDSSNITHAVWRNGTYIMYANSSDRTNWRSRIIFNGNALPYLSCKGNNVTICYATGTKVLVNVSTNNGVTWVNFVLNPGPSTPAYSTCDRRGDWIYVIYKSTASPTYIYSNVSNDGGNTWAFNTYVWEDTNLDYPVISINGSGDGNDNVYVVMSNVSGDNIWFVKSTNSANTWSSPTRILISSGKYCSITHNSSIYVTCDEVYSESPPHNHSILYTTSSNGGLTWSSQEVIRYTGNAFTSGYPTISIGNNSYPVVLFHEGNTTGGENKNIFYRRFNGVVWEPVGGIFNVTTDYSGHKFPVSTYDSINGFIDFMYQDVYVSPRNIMYDYLTVAAENPPKWSNNATSVSSPATYSSTQNYGFEVRWIDDSDSNGYNFSYIEHNITGTYTNYTTSRSGNVSYYNFTGIPASTFFFRFYANDSSNAWNKTDQWSYTVNKGYPPFYLNWNLNTSSTSTNTSILAYAKWYVIGTDLNLSKYILSTNNTGFWTNTTYSFSETNNSWSNQTITIQKEREGQVVGFRYFANHTGASVNYTLENATSILTVSINNENPVISSVTYSPSCIEVHGGVTWFWIQNDNNNISVSYCNFTQPNGTIIQKNSSLTNDIGSTSCSDSVDTSGSWYVRIVVGDPAGNSVSALYYFEVRASGQCAGVSPPPGGGGGGGAPKVVEVFVCDEGFIYDTTLGKCVPMPVELLEEKPKIFQLESLFLRPVLTIPLSKINPSYSDLRLSMFHLLIIGTASTYVVTKYPSKFKIRRR